MSKRKRGRSPRPAKTPRRREPPVNVARFLSRAENLLNHDRVQDAIHLLEPLLDSYDDVADLHYYLGYALAQAGDLWGGVEEYERGMEVGSDPVQWLPMAFIYQQLGLRAHALRALRQVLRHQASSAVPDGVRAEVAAWQQDIRDLARSLALSPERAEQGFYHMEEAQRAVQHGDYRAAIDANRRAIKLLGDWPPPRNNLAQALFFHGEPEEAIAVITGVLDKHPDNVQALGNAIHFMAWTGRNEDAQDLWARLRTISPENEELRVKAAEAAAIMDDDEAVYRLLLPLEKRGEIRPDVPGLAQRASFFLAVAEANLGKRSARRRLEVLAPVKPVAGGMLDALKQGRKGLGWADRFSYFGYAEFVSSETIESFIELVTHEEEMPRHVYQQELARFATGFPQLVLVAEKLIWEEMRPDIGILILSDLDMPAADVALLRFGQSQAGEDDDRMEALFALLRKGVISEEQTLRIWLDGEWRDVELRGYEIREQPGPAYSPELAELLEKAMVAFEGEQYEKASRLLERALKLEPNDPELYNNLAATYARSGEMARAKEGWQKALEIDPLHVFARSNLAIRRLYEEGADAAMETLKPLDDVSRFRPEEMAFYSYTQAKIRIRQREYEAAANLLEQALDVLPGYELAEDLLQELQAYEDIQGSWDSWFEGQRKREQGWRARLQAKLTTPNPSLAAALPLYSKEALTAMAREAIRGGGWSALRKAELIERIVQELLDPENVDRMVANLADEDRDALRLVLEQGGSMLWNQFDARFGNDLEASRYWQWHEPETVMGRLRRSGLLVESTVDGEVLIAVPRELQLALARLFV